MDQSLLKKLQDSVVISNNELEMLNIYVAANCNQGSLYYTPTAPAINIATLGTPDFYRSGPTSPPKSSSQYYELVGRNISSIKNKQMKA